MDMGIKMEARNFWDFGGIMGIVEFLLIKVVIFSLFSF